MPILHSRTGRTAIGWLVVEDIFTVFVLVLLPAVFVDPVKKQQLSVAIGINKPEMTCAHRYHFVAGGREIPRLLSAGGQNSSRELFTLTVPGHRLGIAVGSAKVFGVSMALGAFLAGMVVGKIGIQLLARRQRRCRCATLSPYYSSSRWECFLILLSVRPCPYSDL